MFSFNGFVQGTSAEIVFCVNGSDCEHFWHNDSDIRNRQMTALWSRELKRNDEVYLHNIYTNSFYVKSVNRMYWIGYFVNSN